MCGINGIYNYSAASISDPVQRVADMNAVIQHRGPDGSGVWTSEDRLVTLGHQRLSILDLSDAGAQPMHGRSGSTIVYNGEVYNYRDLRSTLTDTVFHSDSDTEVLLALLEKNGPDCLENLNGMFAFAFWDRENSKLVLARDRIGIKPLYFTTRNGVFAFASEIKSLLTLPWVRAELDEAALYDFLTFNRVAPPDTVFKNIQKFHPGHLMIVGKGGIEKYDPYWEVEYEDLDGVDEAEICERLMEEFQRSVSSRMVSDVPVGAFLSGGVDSSAVVAAMSQKVTGPLRTFSVGFENAGEFDEREYAAEVAKQFDTDHHEKLVTPQDVCDFLPHIVDIYDEPLADATSIPMYFISQLARETGTLVVQTGDGADELFCGYRNWLRYAKLYPYFNMLSALPGFMRRGIASAASLANIGDAQKEIFSRAALGQEFFWGGAGGFKESTKQSVLSDAYQKRMDGRSSYEQVLRYSEMFDKLDRGNRTGRDTDWMTYVGLKYIIPNYYLLRADRMGMAHSVELRVPFLDHQFVNLAMSVPANLKSGTSEPKYILKKALEGTLTHRTLYRKKQGFCVPLQDWAGDIMLGFIEDNAAQFAKETGIFSQQGLQDLVRATRSGRDEFIFPLWNVYFLMTWFKKWLL